MIDTDRYTIAQLLVFARKEGQAWQDLSAILNTHLLDRDRRLALWHSAEYHAERCAEYMSAARLRMAEEDACHG